MMDKPYPNIPRQGTHRPDPDVRKTGTSVRAPRAPDPAKTEGEPVQTLQLSFNETEGLYRLRNWTSGEIPVPQDTYTEIGRFGGSTAFADALEQLPNKPRFVVMEHSQTGDVFYGRESNLSDNWSAGGRFDQITIFDSEEAAAAYAEERQRT